MHLISILACQSITSLSSLSCRTISTLVPSTRSITAHRVSRWWTPSSIASRRSNHNTLFISLLLTLTHRPDDVSEIAFMCRRKQQGAVLYLPVEAKRQDTVARGDFG